MRRQEREVRDGRQIRDILETGLVCRLGLCDGQQPYVVPMMYGYRDGSLYVHSAREGRKIDILKRNDRVCVEIDIDTRIVRSDSPCRWTARYRSVIGFGRARIIDETEQKIAALDVIMEHYGAGGGEYDERTLGRTIVIEVIIESMSGKASV